MEKFEKLKKEVDSLYQKKDKNRAAWADYLYSNHIYIVAGNAEKFSEKYNAKKEITMAAAILHDIADAVMFRGNNGHEERSFKIAKELLFFSGYNENETSIIINDAMKYHGCHDGEIPQTLEGKILATADAYTHLFSDFYPNRIEEFRKRESLEKAKEWALPKIDRDLYQKIFFDDVREEAKPRYEYLKEYINNLK